MNKAKEMYDYHAWANMKMFERLKELPEDVYKKGMKPSIFPSVSAVMVHIYLTDNLWLEMMKGKDMKEQFLVSNELRIKLEACTLQEMEDMYADLADRYGEYIQNHEMEKMFTVDNPYAGLLDTTPHETIFHISTHGNYHRGNVAAMLRQEGYPSVMQDYGLYLYTKKSGFQSPV